MRTHPNRRTAVLAGLVMAVALTAAACVPEPPPPPPTTTTTTTTSTSTSTTTTLPGNQPPVAVASATPSAPGYFGLPVTFSSSGSTDPDGTIVSYLWDFGSSGAPSTLANPIKTYTEPGPYTVTLTVTDNNGATGTTTVTLAQPAPAGDVFISENPITIGTGNPGTKTIKVWWNNQKPDTLMFLDICRKPNQDPTFRADLDCATLASQTPNGTLSGSGVYDVTAFRGEEESGDLRWGCFAAADTAPAGIQKNTTCYVRVTNYVLSNNFEARDIPFTINPA